MTTVLDLVALEEGTYVINAAWLDEDSLPTIPTTALWTLSDDLGNVVNVREDVPVTGISTTNDILLKGDDLAMSATYHGSKRVFLVKGTYNSTLGSGLPFRVQIEFDIENLVKVP